MYPAAAGGERAAKITLFVGRTHVVTGVRSRVSDYGYRDVPRRRRWRASSKNRTFCCSHSRR